MDTVFSGIQPSGELHLGNYLGAVRNWVRLQQEGPGTARAAKKGWRCFFCIVDYHAITQPYEVSQLRERTRDMVTDLMACGVDPEKAVLFVQSDVPEHTELCWILSSVAPFGELGRMTQFKDKSENQADSVNVGLFTYPVLQTADILLYRGTQVPVGQDQLQHLELAREIVRKFNRRYGDTFDEPQALLTETPKILGLDGQAKMSKSLGNTIGLGESDDAIWKKLAVAATDPARVRRTDPGDPDKCNVYTLHTFFTPEDEKQWVRQGCTTAGIGCIDCKKALHKNLVDHLVPIRDKQQELRARPDQVTEALAASTKKARAVAAETIENVRERIGLGPVPL